MSKMGIKLGADPELFVRDKGTKKFVSAAGFFPGTKTQPFKIDKGAVQVDGTALEFNIDAAKNEEEFFQNIRAVYNQAHEMVQGVNKEWELCIAPVAEFDEVLWKQIPEDAKILGCDPDYNVSGTVNPNPGDQLINTPLRTGSGHIHIGWSEGEEPSDPMHFEDCRFMAEAYHKAGLFNARSSAEFKRLKYYGANGAFRPKTYGVELRSPSNEWLRTEQQVRETYRKVHTNFYKFAGL
jgi:hypothetical protein